MRGKYIVVIELTGIRCEARYNTLNECYTYGKYECKRLGISSYRILNSKDNSLNRIVVLC